jgi:hypothetical protein
MSLSSPFNYGVPDSNQLYLHQGYLTNKTVIHVVWYREYSGNFGYDNIVSYELYARKNNT